MKNLLTKFCALLILIVVAGCEKKDESKQECETNKTGTITISNSSSNPYDIYIDDVYKMRLNGKVVSNPIDISEVNNRKLYAEQVSGYVLYPTRKTDYFNVVRCSDYSWQIP